jgi:hypothetical protein
MTMKCYRVVPVDEAGEGMVLYTDLRDAGGNVLLPRQTALSGTLLRSLARRGIDTLLIVDDTVAPEQLAAERARVLERLAYLCRRAGDGRANALLRGVVEEYRMATLS